jgi:hypothetical protein
VDVYDTQTRSLLQSTPYPAISSLDQDVRKQDDGTFVIRFGPNEPADGPANWIPTTPGKAWLILFRLYGPLEPWFDKTWRLPDIEPSTHD